MHLGVGGAGATRMTLRNRGTPAGFSRLAAPVVERAMRRATTKDLARLSVVLESHGDADRRRAMAAHARLWRR